MFRKCKWSFDRSALRIYDNERFQCPLIVIGSKSIKITVGPVKQILGRRLKFDNLGRLKSGDDYESLM